MKESFGCGIIDQGMSYSGGRIILNEDDFVIKGGFFGNFEHKFCYSDITSLQYTVVLQKIHFNCKNETRIVNISIFSRFALNKILKVFKKNNVQCYAYHTKSNNLILKFREWYCFWLKN